MSLTVGDTSPDLTGVCSSQTGSTSTPANITGATLSLKLKKPSDVVVTKVGTIVSGAAGSWSYTWQTGDLDEAGTWTVAVKVTFSNGRVQTFGPADFAVQALIS